ncbi:hypothetical protein TNCV_4832141 [Trichonephila clavipes]|nr:hypothetical protein TNCV_4832141 [Trichonephila clavipes]
MIYSQFGLAIHQNDQRRKWEDCRCFFISEFFSDEAHFWLNERQAQNCRIWSEANPRKCMYHPERLNVWCALCWTNHLYFFKNDENINGDRYRP